MEIDVNLIVLALEALREQCESALEGEIDREQRSMLYERIYDIENQISVVKVRGPILNRFSNVYFADNK